MAAKGGGSSDPLVEQATKWTEKKEPMRLTGKHAAKMCDDCWKADFERYQIKSRLDASVFPKFQKSKTEKYIELDKKGQFSNFIDALGKAVADEKKIKDKKEANVDEITAKLKELLLAKEGAQKKTTAISKTGGVGRMTDTSQYTGSHKERFGEDGKGKGAAGRTDRVENTGYVGAYKETGTYDKKH